MKIIAYSVTNERIDVLAVMDAGIASLMEGRGTLWTARDVSEMRDAVAELIEADKEYDAAFAAPNIPRKVRVAAIKRRAAALARVDGAS